MQRKQVIKLLMFFTIVIVFFSFLFLSLITLNVLYATLALALLLVSSILSRFYLTKIKGYEPIPSQEEILHGVQLLGVALTLISIGLVGYQKSYIQLLMQEEVAFFTWIGGLCIVTLGEIAIRTRRGHLRFKRGVYLKETVETAKEAKFVTLAPVDTRLNVDKHFSDFVKKRLIKQKLMLRSKQKISLKVLPLPVPLTDFIPFEVLETEPEGDVRVTKETTVRVVSESTGDS